MFNTIFKRIKEHFSNYQSEKPVSRWPLPARILKVKKEAKEKTGRDFDILHPETFSEKTAWMSLFYRNRNLAEILDRITLKAFVKKRTGEYLTTAIFGSWNDIQSLKDDWEDLPETFILKSNLSWIQNESVTVAEKSNMNQDEILKQAEKLLGTVDAWQCTGRHPEIKPAITAEELLKPGSRKSFHVLCFNGSPEIVMSKENREPDRRSYYSLEWEKQPFSDQGSPEVEEPESLQKMLNISDLLSTGFPYCEVEFSEGPDGLIITDLTLFPDWFVNQYKWNKLLGDKIKLPETVLTGTLKVLQKAKQKLERWFQKPVNRWSQKKRIQKAMSDFRHLSGYEFNLEHPVSYTEKRVWYQLFYEHPDFPMICDKYLFKKYIEEKLGPGYTAPLYGMWTNIRDLKKDWESLPNKFVLKSNCSSLERNILFVRNKEEVDKNEILKEVKEWFNPMNTGINSCNRAYYKVKPRIIAEKMLESDLDQLYDYKVMCFNGRAEILLGTADRIINDKNLASYSFYDLSWNKMAVTVKDHPRKDIPKPEHLEQIIRIAEKLSKGFPHVRVDFYDTTEGLKIGEMTFYHSGYFDQKDFDLYLGNLFILPFKEDPTLNAKR